MIMGVISAFLSVVSTLIATVVELVVAPLVMPLVHRNLVPDFLIRMGVRAGLKTRLADVRRMNALRV